MTGIFLLQGLTFGFLIGCITSIFPCQTKSTWIGAVGVVVGLVLGYISGGLLKWHFR